MRLAEIFVTFKKYAQKYCTILWGLGKPWKKYISAIYFSMGGTGPL